MIQPENTWATERLVARPATSAHARLIFEQYASDPAVAKYMIWRPHRSVDETIDLFCYSIVRAG
jgi:RimJ/RimL family protein N-acetyltransferase